MNRMSKAAGCLVVVVFLGFVASNAPADLIDKNGNTVLSNFTMDGQIGDWGIQLQLVPGFWTTFNALSFIPTAPNQDTGKDIAYYVEDYPTSDVRPPGGEEFDYEAIYFTDVAGFVLAAVISSHPFDPLDNNFSIEFNNVGFGWEDLTEFASADLLMDEAIGGTKFPNYFWEGSVDTTEGGGFGTDSPWFTFANQGCQNDIIEMGGGGEIPEPASVLLTCAGALLAAGYSRVRRKS
jgi:hypothetical protein